MRTKFYFNTGVKPEHRTQKRPGEVWMPAVGGGLTLCIPFECDDVPPGSVFQWACDTLDAGHDGMLVRTIHNSKLVSKFAFFTKPIERANP